MMEFLQEPVNLKSKKHLAAVASLVVVVFLLIAIPLTVISVFRSGEVSENPKAASTVSPLIFGTNLGLYDASDQFLTSAATRQQMKNIHVSLVRMPIRQEGCPATWEVQAAQYIHDLGMSPIVILKFTQTDPTAAAKCVIQQMNNIYGNSVVYYEFGNERNDVIDKAGYTNTWNQVISQVKSTALNGKFIGPVTSWPDTSYISYFVQNANPAPDYVSYHQYSCSSSNTASECLGKIPTYATHLNEIKTAIAGTGKPVPPIMLTEWNYDPVPPNPDPRVTASFEQQYTQAMLNELANDGFFATTHYVVTGSGVYQLIDSSGNLTPEGQMFGQMYDSLIGGGSDTTAPTVSLTSPAYNATVSGNVNVTANATDNVGVTKVDFFVDGTIVSSDSVTPYTVSWDSKTVGNGSHSITAKAYDSASNVGTSTPVSVTVQNGDTTLPTVSITAPTNGSTVTGNVNVTANASDNVGVARVEFYVDSVLQNSDTTSPYGFTWDSTKVTNGNHSIDARAFDAAGNKQADTVTVTAKNGDTTPPSTPTNLTATATAYNNVNLSWAASTDNVGVTGYWIIRGGTTIGSSATNSYSDTTVSPSTAYSYQVVAYDAAGNNSAPSNTATATTPSAPDTQAPTAPGNLTATAASSSQINLSWTASTDNIGVTGYEVYRNSTKVATVTITSFGDTGLSASTIYSYFIKARDAAGNISAASNTTTATTQSPPPVSVGNISGTVSSSAGGVLSGAKVSVTVNGSKKTYATTSVGTYTITNLPAGIYSLKFSATKYISQTVSVTVTSNTTVTKNITLQKR